MNPPQTGYTESALSEYRATSLTRGATHSSTPALGYTGELGMHRLPLIKFNVLSPPFKARPTPFPLSPVYADIQSPIVNNEAMATPEYRPPLTWLPFETEFGKTPGPSSGLGPPAATVELPVERGTSSSPRLQPASQPSDRDEEIRQGWINLKRYCHCNDRTKKPLRHWEDQCPYNLNKGPLLYCKLPGCRNRTGFRARYNLERHQKKASHHTARNELEAV